VRWGGGGKKKERRAAGGPVALRNSRSGLSRSQIRATNKLPEALSITALAGVAPMGAPSNDPLAADAMLPQSVALIPAKID